MSNKTNSKIVTKEKLVRLRSLLIEKCEFVDYGTISCAIPIKKMQQLQDENLALASIEDTFSKIAKKISQEGNEFDDIDLELMFYLCFSKRKGRHFYRSQELGDMVLLNIRDYSFRKDEKEGREEEHKMPQTHPLIPVSFDKMVSLLNENGYRIEFESFDDLIHAYAKDLPMCARIRKEYTTQKNNPYQKTKKNV